MEKITVKCPYCGQVFTTENIDVTVCENCKKEFSTNQGAKYFKSLKSIETENQKVALGEAYAKVDLLLEQGEFYLNNEDYENAEKSYLDALKLSTVDYRIYLGMVYVKTKNFEDLKDKTHYEYLENAINFANEEQKEYIKKIYTPYYRKSQIPVEELNEYAEQECEKRFLRIEELLKSGIPANYRAEKAKKIFLILSLSFIIPTLAFGIISFFYESIVFTILGVIFFALECVSTVQYSSTKTKTETYNFLLDFYDEYKKFDFAPNLSVKILKNYEKAVVSALNKDSNLNIRNTLLKIYEDISNYGYEKAVDFFEKYKVLR